MNSVTNITCVLKICQKQKKLLSKLHMNIKYFLLRFLIKEKVFKKLLVS